MYPFNGTDGTVIQVTVDNRLLFSYVDTYSLRPLIGGAPVLSTAANGQAFFANVSATAIVKTIGFGSSSFGGRDYMYGQLPYAITPSANPYPILCAVLSKVEQTALNGVLSVRVRYQSLPTDSLYDASNLDFTVAATTVTTCVVNPSFLQTTPGPTGTVYFGILNTGVSVQHPVLTVQVVPDVPQISLNVFTPLSSISSPNWAVASGRVGTYFMRVYFNAPYDLARFEITRSDATPSSVSVTVQISEWDQLSSNLPHPSNSNAQFTNTTQGPTVTTLTVPTPTYQGWYWLTVTLRSFNTTNPLASVSDVPLSVRVVVPVPTITGITTTPANSFPTSGGVVVTIAGTTLGLMNSTFVSVGATNCTVVSAIPTEVQCILRAGSGRFLPVTVNAFGVVSNAVNISYNAPASSSQPSAGPTAGGITIFFTGSNFGPADAVRSIWIGPNLCPIVGVPTHTAMNCTLPAGRGSLLPVSITISGQSFSLVSTFTYDAPYINVLTPTNGPSAGSIITLIGRNFGPDGLSPFVTATGTYVTVNSVPCLLPIDGIQPIINDSYIRCRPQPDTVNNAVVRVSVYNQLSFESALIYKFDAAIVTGIVPPNGPTGGGTRFVLYGYNFGPSSFVFSVLIGPNAATACVHHNDTTVSCTTPAGDNSGRVVSLSAWPQQTVPAPVSFLYDVPRVIGVSPPTGPTSGGPITITGENFGPPCITPACAGNTLLVSLGPAGSEGGSAVAVACPVVYNAAPYSNDTFLVCQMPSGVGTNYPITVTRSNSPSPATALRWSYAPPVVSVLTPYFDVTDGGVRMTIQGNNFGPDATAVTVTIGGVLCTVPGPVIGFAQNTHIACTV